MLYEQFLRTQIPKALKRQYSCQSFFTLLGSACIIAARRTLMKLTPSVVREREEGFGGILFSPKKNEKKKFLWKNSYFSFLQVLAVTNWELVPLQRRMSKPTKTEKIRNKNRKP